MFLNIVLALVVLAVAAVAAGGVVLANLALRRSSAKSETFRTGTTEYLDRDAWERAKAGMALEELERWNRMNLAESKRLERVCDICGARVSACRCAYSIEGGARGDISIPSSAGIASRKAGR